MSVEVTTTAADFAELRRQRDFLLEANNRLLTERRMADDQAQQAMAMTKQGFIRQSELMDKLERAQQMYWELKLERA